MTAPALELRGFAAGYGPLRVLDGIDLILPRGSRLALLGRNGAGKSTLARAVIGLATRQNGEILLEGREIGHWPVAKRARAGLGYVPQTREIFASLSVEDNLLLGAGVRRSAAIEEAYALFPRLRERRRIAGSRLSGGEQQMLAIARTLLTRPRLLLLDEPLEGLAPKPADDVMTALVALAGRGEMTILLAEQRIDAALAFADHAAIMERGRLAWHGPSARLAAQPDILSRWIGLDHPPADCIRCDH